MWKIINIVILVFFSSGWLFPLGGAAFHLLDYVANPFMEIEGMPIKKVILQFLAIGFVWLGAVVVCWSGYLGWKFFPAPEQQRNTKKK